MTVPQLMPFFHAQSSMPTTRTKLGSAWVWSLRLIIRRIVVRSTGMPRRHISRGTAAGGMSDEPHDPGQTGGSARVGRRQIGKSFGKDVLFAMVIAAPPAGQPCADRDRRSLDREITERSQIGAVPKSGSGSTSEVCRTSIAGQRDDPAVIFPFNPHTS
jgi:hypothetical protein